jgi:nitroimidazol reductase NimA-like FMN-containing flavoprotein (pyridoxamine 5'-phosphate oxidase superfamily)
VTCALDPHELSLAECEHLLDAGRVARVALSTPTGPYIVPVDYVMVDGAIVLATKPSSLLSTHGAGSIVALEIDQFDVERRHGWSVVARGRADVLTSTAIRVRWTELSGRRLE